MSRRTEEVLYAVALLLVGMGLGAAWLAVLLWASGLIR